MTEDELRNWFSFQQPTAEQLALMKRWRDGLSTVASHFVEHTEGGAEVALALRQLKKALCTMHQAVLKPVPQPIAKAS